MNKSKEAQTKPEAGQTLAPAALLAAMVEMSDDELYSLIRDALEKRKVQYYKESADDFGWPTWTAKLAVMRQICCS